MGRAGPFATSIPPYLQPEPHNFTNGDNFASAGAGVLVETNPGTINLPLQLSYMENVTDLLQEQLGDEEAKKLLGSAVYLISMGGNDHFSFYEEYEENATEALVQELVGIVIGNLTTVLHEIYNLGGRKIAFQNAGPIGCLPGFKLSIFEYYDELDDRVLKPIKYGFKNGADACCGNGAYRGSDFGGVNGTVAYDLCSNPGDNVWFDGSHTTGKANQQLAELIWSGTPNVTWPYSVQQLFELA